MDSRCGLDVQVCAMRAGKSLSVSSADAGRLRSVVQDRNAPQKHVWRAENRAVDRRGRRHERDQGLINSWCKSLSYNGIIRARSNSTPARPYMARLRVFSLLICPSVCPLLQGSDIAFRTASRSWRIVFAKRCIA